MTEAYSRESASGPARRDDPAHRAARWLGLAAAPTFAAMALLTGFRGGGSMAHICGAEPSFLRGMVPMYLLMCGFHAAPWAVLIGDRSRATIRRLKS